MANIIILGGGFGGVVAAERLAKTLGGEHQLTLVSARREFIFYPALVRLAFGLCSQEDVTFDLSSAMLDRRVRFVEGEVARLDPRARRVTLAHGDVEGELGYDYLIYALGRRLATEHVPGFFEYAHHLLTVEAALKFGKALHNFKGGHAVIGCCPGSRLTVPAYETAFALSRLLEERGARERTRITFVSPESFNDAPAGHEAASTLHAALAKHGIESLSDFHISHITESSVRTSGGHNLGYDLLMLIPPFRGAGAVARLGITDSHGYVLVDRNMRVAGVEGMYAAGDAVGFGGPKMGHMAVRQGEVAALNVAAEIEGREPLAEYDHELMLVVDEGGRDSIYLRKQLWADEPASVHQGRFWSWAKRAHEKYWQMQHQ
jgi:NADH dehydrogenase FAD-containing subunit